MLAVPSPHALGTTCHQCLAPLAPGSAASPGHTTAAAASTSASASGAALPFCSPSCTSAARQAWAQAGAGCDFRELQQACRESGEKFPLMLAQLAGLHIQRHLIGGSSAAAAAAAAEDAAADVVLRGDPLTQLRHLCYANIGEAPEPWVQMHRLLLQGLQPLCSISSGSSGGGSGASGGDSRRGPAQACSSGWLQERISLQWFCDGLARLHLNSFR